MLEKKQSKGSATRQSILEIAEKEFAQLGYDAAKLETIADAVGIKRAAIFYHFKSKRELFDALTMDIRDTLVVMTRRSLEGVSDPWEKLMLLVEAWLDYMVARPTAARLVLRNCANAVIPENYCSVYSEDSLQILRDVINEGVSIGRFAEGNAMYLVNLVTGSILHYVCNPEQLGFERPYRPEDPVEVATFKSILRKTARVVLDVSEVGVAPAAAKAV